MQFLPSSVSSVTIRIVKKAENKAEIRPRKRETLNKFYERFLSIVRLQTFFSLSSYNFFINSALIHFNDFQRRMWFFIQIYDFSLYPSSWYRKSFLTTHSAHLILFIVSMLKIYFLYNIELLTMHTSGSLQKYPISMVLRVTFEKLKNFILLLTFLSGC